MPWYDTKTGYVVNSYTDPFRREELPGLGRVVFWILRNFRLAHVVPHVDGTFRVSNLTLINFVMYVCGPSREDVLCCRPTGHQMHMTFMCVLPVGHDAPFPFEDLVPVTITPSGNHDPDSMYFIPVARRVCLQLI